MAKKTVEEKHSESEDYLSKITRNPLANYKSLMKSRPRRTQKTFASTSISDNIRLDFLGYSPGDKFYVTDEVGEANYCKLLATAKNRDLIMLLGPNTQKLFLWIVYALRYRSDVVVIDLPQMGKTGFHMARNTFSKAVIELEDKAIIKRVTTTRKHTDYWKFYINPEVMFKGDAVKFYQDVIRHHPEYY